MAYAVATQAQKKPLDHSVYDIWQDVGAQQLSENGNIATWLVCPGEGDTTLVIRNNRNKHEISIARAKRARISHDEKHVVCIIKPEFQLARKARNKKWNEDKRPKDSLAIVDMATGKMRKFPNVSNFQMPQEAGNIIAFTTNDTTIIPKKQRKNKNIGRPMLVVDLNTQRTDTIKNVTSCSFNRQGTRLAFIMQKNKNKMMTAFYDVATCKTHVLSDTVAWCAMPNFSYNGDKMLWLATTDTAATGSKRCDIWEYAFGKDSKGRQILKYNDIKTDDKSLIINENAQPQYSRNGKNIFAGVAPIIEPNDTNIFASETPQIDIWNYDAPELPPLQKANRARIAKRTLLASLSSGKLVPLTTSAFDRLQLVNHGNANYVLSEDNTRNIVATQWDMQQTSKIDLVSLDGTRKNIAQAVVGRVTSSPEGKFIAWYDMNARAWVLYNVSKGETRNLTEGLDINFWNEEDDRPRTPSSYGMAGWTANDEDLIVYDRYDLWLLPTNGSKPTCITKGEGRNSDRVFRYVNLKQPDEDQSIDKGKLIMLSIFDNKTKQNGVATLNIKSKALTTQRLEGYSFGKPVKAKNNNTMLYTRGNFENPNDLYISNNFGKQQQQLTNINPQQKDYNWGTVELVHWNAFDGTPLDGLLYKPEDFNPDKKYPMMIYFYERRSETLYNYIKPQPSWSTINIAFYTSRGYLVFVPDIVYTAGLPGESAYNCIVSGAQALAKNKWVNSERMAIQGQSWGGYQVAYLITRTNIFRCAGAGAPVSNMTSAYGGIRWESGMSRQFQYEHDQSRIGQNLWQAPELYIANSPLFKMPNCQTPVLIMHNDADGAVPWYQGIEMFMALRRLQKPAWLLQYNNEAHNLKQRRNRKDLSIRLQQFFDYYMKDQPMPSWMKQQVPITRKGQELGYE